MDTYYYYNYKFMDTYYHYSYHHSKNCTKHDMIYDYKPIIYALHING